MSTARAGLSATCATVHFARHNIVPVKCRSPFVARLGVADGGTSDASGLYAFARASRVHPAVAAVAVADAEYEAANVDRLCAQGVRSPWRWRPTVRRVAG